MPRVRVTVAVERFWDQLLELLGELYKKVKDLIIVKPKGGADVVVYIQRQAVRMLGLGMRRRKFKGRPREVIHQIAEAWSSTH